MLSIDRQIIFFDGFPLYHVSMAHEDLGYSSLYTIGETYTYSRPISLSCRIPYTRTNACAVDYWASNRCKKMFGILGTGYLCKNCGDYNPSGSLTCLKCGGNAEEQWLKPLQCEYHVAQIDFPAMPLYRDEQEWIIVDLAFPDRQKATDALSSLFHTKKTFSVPSGYSLDLGYYLCSFCGQAVPEGETCSGCGGWRKPFSELITLERKCVYCGCDVLGSIVCPGCGRRIKGLTVKEIL